MILAPQLNCLSEELNVEKHIKEVKLASILYNLTASADKEKFAKEYDIYLSGEKVRVFIFLDPNSLESERKKIVKTHNILVEKISNNVMRALVGVDILIPLSREPIIQFINVPDKPSKE